MMIRAFAALALGLMFTAAAQASASCYARAPGAHVSFGIRIGGEFTQDERDRFNLMQLRQMGVDASRAEMWGGCIRAFVRKPGGGEEMQFFHPDTFERVTP
ncbi:hypothetical protein O9Z70_02265 [Devosia sp. YIM 151766]|uniref:hypothetical protein n=1 Tax=Devosia sp. YIM 151766 TaxID=3017325 RepID=UPI00255C8EB7|nr:hypothetical protein [Devosia sp. YIM 151766]WIY53383.1 hypothetical protein O9Z70_02265 [Devosia sp. YIM 151766]